MIIELATGSLHLEVHAAELPLEALCGFATRRNPKRAFLFVSRVLGRHLPVRPGLIRDVQRRLAAKLPADLPGPVVVTGMAETAVALGQGVHAELQARTGREDLLFLPTTRYALDTPPLLTFAEEHSHAPVHLIHVPERLDLVRAARSLILIDDEASTGRTMLNLAAAFRAVAPNLTHLTGAVITDWRGPRADDPPLVSLLRGSYRWEARADAVVPQMPRVVGDGRSKQALLPRNYGRLGLLRPPPLPAGLLESLNTTPVSGTTLVLGTGEFTYPPQCLAEALEAAGQDVRFQATTRSPILVGGVIEHALELTDNYGDGIPNYLYDARSGLYSRVLVCHETPTGSVSTELLNALDARAVPF